MADTWPDTRRTVGIDHRAVQDENALLRENTVAGDEIFDEHRIRCPGRSWSLLSRQ